MTVNQLITHYVHPTDLADQQRYLEMVKKPSTLICQELGSHLKLINKLMSLWQGQAGNHPFDILGLKRTYYNQMLEPWKLSFLERGLNFLEPTYTFDSII